jgi:hypothetical protein
MGEPAAVILCRGLCLFRQLPHRSEPCGDHGRRGDDGPSRLVADAGYGSAEMVGGLVDERGIEPHVKLMAKAKRTDGALSREPTSPSIQRAIAMSALAAKS